MSTLAIEGVSKRYRRGPREFVALREVSLTVARGELVVVLGTRKAGCSTLLRVAAGLERPDSGRVRVDGMELSRARHALGRTIAYCHTTFSSMEGELVLEHVSAPLLAQGTSPRHARRAAGGLLERTSVAHCAGMHPDELDGSERVRVGLARALATSPAILIVDDPTAGVGLLQVDGILRMLRSLAKDEDRGVLMSTNDAMCISGADRALSLDDGQLRGEEEASRAEVIPLLPRPLGAGPQAHTG